MEAFTASLTADAMRVSLLQAHAHAADVRDPGWEIHDLTKAVESFGRLSEQMEAVKARLAKLTGPRCVNHPEQPSRVNLDGEDLCQDCANDWARAEGLEPDFRRLGQ